MFYHTTIVGLPGSGKTWTAKAMLAKVSHGCVFIDLAPRDLAYGVPVVYTGRDAMKALLEGRKVAWPAPVWEVVSWVDIVLQTQRTRNPMPPVTLFIDEAHLIAPKGSIVVERDAPPDPIGMLATQGDNHLNVRAIWITQRPQSLDPWVYRTATVKIFHRLDPADRDYFRRQGVTVPDLQGHDIHIIAPGMGTAQEEGDDDDGDEDGAGDGEGDGGPVPGDGDGPGVAEGPGDGPPGEGADPGKGAEGSP